MSDQRLISADSHVLEDPRLWVDNLPARFADDAPRFPELSAQAVASRPGGFDSSKRVAEMEEDGVSGELLYPSSALGLFSMENVELQQACFRVYNDWIVEYVSASPERLFGIAVLSPYDVDQAVEELVRAKDQGCVGAMVWQRPPPGLEFCTRHYERLWAAAAEARMPVSLHILTGVGHPFKVDSQLSAAVDRLVNVKLRYAMKAVSDLITSGVFDRHPDLKVCLVENEVSWLPFVIAQLDKYAERSEKGGGRKKFESPMTRLPSEYFESNMFATFFDDQPARYFLGEWGSRNLMWSNDYPHPNSTWPNSRKVVDRDLGHVEQPLLSQLLEGNVRELYGLPVPA